MSEQEAKELTHTEWLRKMNTWTQAEIEAVLLDESAPAAKKEVAIQRRHALDKSITPAGKIVSGPAFERIVDRLEGKAKGDVTPAANILINIGMSELDGRINQYLSDPTTEGRTFELRPQLALPGDGPSHTEDTGRERPDPA